MIHYLKENTTLVNRYQIIKFISKGGMGAVYNAFDTRLKCKVAVKQNLLNQNNRTKQLFQREAELLANLKHIGLPKVTDYFPHENQYYLIMELVEGEDLQSSIDRHEIFSYEKGLHFFEKLLDILIYLHSYNIIHADIKPSNLKIDNEEHNLKLLDFGIAKGRIGQVTQELDSTGGTPLYMSLEQTGLLASNDIQVTTISDLYSASATFYHLLTGSEPIPSVQRYLIKENEGLDPQRLISDLNPEFPKSVAEIFHKGMELLPKDRIQTAIEYRFLMQQKKGDKLKKYTKWPSEKRTHRILDSFIIPSIEGLTPMSIIGESGESEMVLYYFDRTSFIYKLAQIKPFKLNLKPILYQTSRGFILCLFFYIPNPETPGEDFFSIENYVNLYNPTILSDFFQLARQSHWHLYLVQAEKREIVDVFEFENCYDLEKTLNKAMNLTRNTPRGDFMKAKQEFTDTFTMDDLFNMT
jgi:serine/threonine protein kinase